MTFLRQHLHAFAATLNKFTVDDRLHTVGASDVGQCERRVYWQKNHGDPDYGVPTDPDHVDNYGARLRGTMFEDVFWAPALLNQFGKRLLYCGKDQKTLMSGYLSATPDGLLTELTDEERAVVGPDCGTEIVVECKTFDPRTNLIEAKAENVYQTHVQLGLFHECTPYKPTHAIISYTDASWWDTGKEFIIKFDPEIYATAKKRADRIMNAKSAREMRPEGVIAGGTECEYCMFTRACGVERRYPADTEVLASIDPQFLAEVTDMAREIKKHDIAAEAETVMVADLKEQLRERLREKHVRKVPGVVSWTSVKGRAGYDNKAIREAASAKGIDIEQFATEGTPGDRMTITLKE